MSIPANITSEMAFLQAQVNAASPLNAAPRATIAAIKLNAAKLVNDVQAALVAANTLDTWTAPVDAGAIISGVLSVSQVAQDQNKLALMRGIVGRVASNVDQIAS